MGRPLGDGTLLFLFKPPNSLRVNYGIQCMPCSARIVSEMLPEIHTMEKCDFRNSIIHPRIFKFSVLSCFVLRVVFLVFLLSYVVFMVCGDPMCRPFCLL